MEKEIIKIAVFVYATQMLEGQDEECIDLERLEDIIIGGTDRLIDAYYSLTTEEKQDCVDKINFYLDMFYGLDDGVA